MGPLSGRRRLATLLATSVAVACGDPSSAPSFGAVVARAVTAGESPDPDGYRLAADGGTPLVIPSAGSVILPPLPSGDHSVALSGVAPNCALAGDSIRHITVNPGETTAVDFSVTCRPTTGAVLIRTASTGEDLDPNGYTVLLDGIPAGTVAANGSSLIAAATGEHAVSLTDLTPNCTLNDPPSAAVRIETGELVPAEFSITCAAAPLAGHGAELAFMTTRYHGEDFGNPRDAAEMNSDGTGARALLQALGPVAWAPDGTELAVGTGNRILIGSLDAAGVLTGTRDLTPQGDEIIGLAWSPDGSRLAYYTGFADGSGTEVNTITRDGKTDRSLAFAGTSVDQEGNPTWSPDGRRIAISQSGGPGLGGVYFLDPAREQQDPEGPVFFGTTPAWSPDGTRIAFASTAVGAPDADLYTADPDGSHLTRLTSAPGDDGAPAWSPDGSRIAFVSHRDGNAEIYVMDRDGSHVTRLTRDPAVDTLPSWRP